MSVKWIFILPFLLQYIFPYSTKLIFFYVCNSIMINEYLNIKTFSEFLHYRFKFTKISILTYNNQKANFFLEILLENCFSG